MEWNEIVSTVLKTIVTGVVTFAIPYLFSLIRTKTDNELLQNMIDLAEQTCVNCVLAVDQTFVDELKKNGQFTPEKQKEAFELCKQVLTEAPVRAHAMPSRPYRVYSDACDYGLAAILQQIQPIQMRDLKGTKTYDRLVKAHRKGDPVPSLVAQVAKNDPDVPPPGEWANDPEDTIVYVERVIAYWSRILKSAERNYSPTEREALALREGLIKFQPYIEGEQVLAITDHAALTWGRTFQNVNRRLLTWGTTFAAYPNLRIVHRAGRVHSNVDPISRLRRRVPQQEGPCELDGITLTIGEQTNDPLKNTFDELGPRFEERLLEVAAQHAQTIIEGTRPGVNLGETLDGPVKYAPESYRAAAAHSLLIGIAPEDVLEWRNGYANDPHFREVLRAIQGDVPDRPTFPQYYLSDEGLLYFEDWNGASKLCVPTEQRVSVMKENHDEKTEGAHCGYHRTYNRIATVYYWPRMSRDIKHYAATCDLCQKAKPRRHGGVGLLQPIPIPSQPFEVVTMDNIPDLPNSNGNDNVLVIADKLTKYGLFLAGKTTDDAIATADRFFERVVVHFGLPRQVITDRDARWRSDFWGQLCKNMGMKRALTTAHHPQSDGQTEILNQTLEIALRSYVSEYRDDWSTHLDGLMLAYNTTPHTATGYAPSYLLRGYTPITGATMMSSPAGIPRPIPRHLTGGGGLGVWTWW